MASKRRKEEGNSRSTDYLGCSSGVSVEVLIVIGYSGRRERVYILVKKSVLNDVLTRTARKMRRYDYYTDIYNTQDTGIPEGFDDEVMRV